MPPTPSSTDTCPECGKVFPRNGHLRRHLNTVHSTQKPFPCLHPSCQKRFSRKDLRDQHQTRHDPSSRRFPCSSCSKRFSTASHLRRHQLTHTKPLPYTCSDCPKSFPKRRALLSHRTIHTGLLPYACTEPSCNRRFPLPSDLKQHTQQSHKIYFCPGSGCEQREPFRKFSHFVLHRNQCHPTEKKFLACEECGKTFQVVSSFKRHVETHRLPPVERLLFVCKYPGCQARYTTSSNLGTHVRAKHTMVDGFGCEICGERFSLKASWKRHLKSVHAVEMEEMMVPVQRFDCEKCEWKGAFEKALERHCRMVHGGRKGERGHRRIMEEIGMDEDEQEDEVKSLSDGNEDEPVIKGVVTRSRSSRSLKSNPKEQLPVIQSPPSASQSFELDWCEEENDIMDMEEEQIEECENFDQVDKQNHVAKSSTVVHENDHNKEEKARQRSVRKGFVTRSRSSRSCKSNQQEELPVVQQLSSSPGCQSFGLDWHASNHQLMSTSNWFTTNQTNHDSNDNVTNTNTNCGVASELFGAIPTYLNHHQQSNINEIQNRDESSESCFQVATRC